MFTIDHSQATEFETIKPGEYEVVVINYEQTTSQNGNPRVIVDYEIRSDVDQPCKGQKILFDNFTVTDKAMWRFQAASKAAGFPHGANFKSFKEWAEKFVGKHLRLVVGEREYNGKKYPQVNGFKESQVSAPATIAINDEDIPF